MWWRFHFKNPISRIGGNFFIGALNFKRLLRPAGGWGIGYNAKEASATGGGDAFFAMGFCIRRIRIGGLFGGGDFVAGDGDES